MRSYSFAILVMVLHCVIYADRVWGDTFGSGANTFNIEFVNIGNPGNAADATGVPNPAGKVDYAYRIGKYEISAEMIHKANDLGGLGITTNVNRINTPAILVSWFEAARFVNWLNTSTGSIPAYKFDGGGNFQLWSAGDAGYDASNLFRNSLAHYFLPSVDEWYKAAYYDPTGVYFNYPTGSNTAPTDVASGTTPGTAVWKQSEFPGAADITFAGGLSPYGTMGQGGNAIEWGETEFDLLNDSTSSARVIRGGYWRDDSDPLLSSYWLSANPTLENTNIGFRVASIPEPSTVLFVALVRVGVFAFGRRQMPR